MSVLYTQGGIVTRTIAELKSYNTIRQSSHDPLGYVQLVVSDSGTLDLSRQLGGVAGDVTMTVDSNQLILGDGNDNALMGAGNDTIFGGAGFDGIYGGLGNDLIYGGADGDYIVAGIRPGTLKIDSSVFYGQDTLYGGDGNDNFGVIASQYHNVTLDGGTGTNVVTFLKETGRVRGLAFDPVPTIAAVQGDVTGNDQGGVFDFSKVGCYYLTIKAMGGDDLIVADGRGYFFGGDGNDTIRALGLDAVLDGGAGGDDLYGSYGSDTFRIDDGNDRLFDNGTHDQDRLIFSSGRFHNLDLQRDMGWASDVTFAKAILSGTDDGDLIKLVGTKIRYLSGATVATGAGDDTLGGTALADTLDGGTGGDVMTGGLGDDI